MNNENEVGEVQVERLDDIPVIFGHLQKMHIQETLDRVITIWLIHILSEHTHCKDRVQTWVAKRCRALRALTGQPVRELDFTDDRLALCLKMLRELEAWHEIEARLSEHLMRVHRLGEGPTVRLDGSTGTVYHEPEQHTLFKVGKAKSGEFATQYKLMLASLDPLGLTLAIDVVAGNQADDPLYAPCYRRLKEVFPESGLLVVGDSKMSALHTRGTIATAGDDYLTLLAHRKDEPELLDTFRAVAG